MWLRGVSTDLLSEEAIQEFEAIKLEDFTKNSHLVGWKSARSSQGGDSVGSYWLCGRAREQNRTWMCG